MQTRTQGLIERWGQRRAKYAVLTLALLSLTIIVGVGALLIIGALRAQRDVEAVGIAVLALIALLLWMRVARSAWASVSVQLIVDVAASEETGVWGVGGPAMRTPGSTGIYGPFPNRRQAEHERRDDQHRP